MQIYLEPVGGVAGDMFVAALLDAWPELEPELTAALAAAGLNQLVTARRQPFADHALTGSRFEVAPAEPAAHAHRAYRDIKAWLGGAELADGARQHALALFELLAEAESSVHGVAIDEVSFHEVGAWDSIADIVASAWLLDRLGVGRWYCAPLPMGQGQVASAHGRLPLPAPAAALLLQGLPLFQDGLSGERITPTGAAIVRYLNPSFEPMAQAARLNRSGIGFGSKAFPGISNILRVLAFDDGAGYGQDRVAVCQFEIDDQTAEDLAVALDRLRALPGVLDVSQSPALGKKGRLLTQVRLLVEPAAVDAVIERCFVETSTLGVRWQIVQRAVLRRELIDDGQGRIKRAWRPDGAVTAKAEMDDLAGLDGGRHGRERRRRRLETDHSSYSSDNDEPNPDSN